MLGVLLLARSVTGQQCGVGEVPDGAGGCKQCQPGFFMPLAGWTGTDCFKCQQALGEFCDRPGCDKCAKVSPTCGAGTAWSDVWSITADRTCPPCAPGTFQASEAHTIAQCASCPAGTYQDESGQAGCKPLSRICRAADFGSSVQVECVLAVGSRLRAPADPTAGTRCRRRRRPTESACSRNAVGAESTRRRL